MAANKTQSTDADISTFLNTVEPARRQADSFALLNIFQEVTGYAPRMWGPSIIGFGRYHYVYESGREGDFLATGFSPRKANLSLYIMPGYADFSDILNDLGKHKTGKSCLYINKLADVDTDVLRRLIRAGLDDLNTKWPVHPV